MSRIAIFLFAIFWAVAAQAFSMTDSKGRTHTLAGYKGKWVLVNFWATWCPPCLAEIPDLVSLYENKKNNLIVLGVAMDYQDRKKVLEFADQLMISYPIILGDYKMAEQVGSVPGLPTTYLYNPQGKLVAYNVGALSREVVEHYISAKKK